MRGPRIDGALERAGLAPVAHDTRQLLDFGLDRIRARDDDVLEITRAAWQTETHGGDGVTILTREMVCIVLAPIATGLLRRKSAPACVQIPFAAIRDLIDDDEEFGSSAIFFVGAQENPDFVLTFPRSAERDRFYPCVFAAHRGEFSRWGLQLDPANYVADFDRFYAEIAGSGVDDPVQLSGWVKERYGDYRIDNALGLASEWRTRELYDIERLTGVSMRAALIGSPSPWGDVPESHRIIVRLGEQLFDAGLLEPPFDERSFDTGEPLRALDAGPARLLAVMALAGYARELRDPRAQEFIDVALAHLKDVPGAVFSQRLREFWSGVAPLPDPDAPREFAIWEDADVRDVSRFEAGQAVYDQDVLTAGDRAQIAGFLSSAGRVDGRDAQTYIAAALSGVNAYEELSPMCPMGWRKLVVYDVSELAHELWRRFSLERETAMLAQWVSVTIESNRWGPDGNSSPLGQHHSYSMSLAGQTGVGILKIDPETGMASAPTGNEARLAASNGSF
jgi:hypothetical protein